MEEVSRDLHADVAWERRARRLMQSTAIATVQCATTTDLLAAALDAICAATTWPIGHAYVADSGGTLHATGIWHLDHPHRYGELRRCTEQSSFAPGIGLPGRVAQARVPQFIADVSLDDNFPRNRLATDLGVRAAFGLPLEDRGRVAAVLEFFTPESVAPDVALLEVLGAVAVQLNGALARNAIAGSDARFRAIAASANDAIISADGQGRIFQWNAAAERMFGYAEPEVLGKDLARVIIPERFRAAHDAGMHRIRAGGERNAIGRTVELSGLRRDGSEFPVELSLATWTELGQPMFSGILRDVTERKEAEARLRGAFEQLEISDRRAREASRAKGRFLANMSHELRTPLNAILGYVQLLERDDAVSVAQRQHLEVISRAGEHLLELVNDVLSISKIEAGEARVHVADFDLYALLDSIRKLFELRLASRRLELAFERSPALPRFVTGDEGKLRQVLLNLVSNAVKFTRTGGVAVRADYRDGRARFEVEDTGPGLATDEIERLFQPFVQASAGQAAKEGTGLGLAISRDCVRLMGGELGVRSELGRGACFGFDIALPPASGTAREVRRRAIGLAPGQEPLRILVVDNAEDSRVLLARLLGAVGFRVEIAVDGLDAVARWRAFRPHFVWMDMRMPNLSGYEATRLIRGEEAMQPVTPRTAIVALTASAFDHDRPEILAAGCDDIVAKPFRESTIFDTLEQRLGVRFAYEDEQPLATPLSDDERRARVGALPARVRSALTSALAIGDDALARAVIAATTDLPADIAAWIDEQLRSFQFDALLSVLEEVTDE